MLWLLAFLLLAVWAVALSIATTLGGFIHVFFVAGLALFTLRVVQEQRSLT